MVDVFNKMLELRFIHGAWFINANYAVHVHGFIINSEQLF